MTPSSEPSFGKHNFGSALLYYSALIQSILKILQLQLSTAHEYKWGILTFLQIEN
jgi:hypothetical protein